MTIGLFNNPAPYHLFIYSLAFGTNIFHSYINAPILFKNLKREDFSHVTNLILPKYFLAEAIVPLGLYLTSPVLYDPRLRKFSIILLGASSAFQFLNYFWLLPTVQKLKTSKLKLEAQLTAVIEENGDNSDEVKELKGELQHMSKQFGKYHGMSLLLNMANTISLTGYGFVLTNGLLRFIPK
ncbi:Tmh18 protein [Saccharomycopsis crataegensis]|uniref:Tmh18 protein n=1 Tax=Saccharomycopsis crataegensis TaxID=43959 RepID=A0AAV5QHA0_9ASCO|nr:Tmh18 protein [Saccharomycopsis crataegensis]